MSQQGDGRSKGNTRSVNPKKAGAECLKLINRHSWKHLLSNFNADKSEGWNTHISMFDNEYNQ